MHVAERPRCAIRAPPKKPAHDGGQGQSSQQFPTHQKTAISSTTTTRTQATQSACPTGVQHMMKQIAYRR